MFAQHKQHYFLWSTGAQEQRLCIHIEYLVLGLDPPQRTQEFKGLKNENITKQNQI